MSKKQDVVIVGGGVVGCSIAYHLAKKGIISTIIEKESIGSRASGKAWAVIEYPPHLLALASFPHGFWSMPESETIARWQYLLWSSYYRLADLALDIKAKGNIDIEYGVAPITLVAISAGWEAHVRQIMSYLKENEYYEYEWLEADDLRTIFPGINPAARGGLCFPQIQVEPYKYTLGLAQAAEAMGVEIRYGDVAGFKTEGRQIKAVKLKSGKNIAADAVVVAMGPWSAAAASWLGKEVPMTFVMDECLRIKPPQAFPMHSITAGVEILSRVNGDVILAVAEVRSKSSYFDLKTRPDFDSSLSEEIKNGNLEAATRLLPELEDAVLVEHRGDILAYGPHPFYFKPVMGFLPEWENGYIATRFGGLGIHTSVGVGEVMAELIAGGQVPAHVKQMMEYLMPS
jgi:glycine oxidase